MAKSVEEDPCIASEVDEYEMYVDEIDRNWREPKDENDFAAWAGQTEKKVLEQLGFNCKPTNPGNGIEPNGWLTEDALEILGVKKYSQLWGNNGRVVKSVKQMLKSPAGSLEAKAAEVNIEKSIDLLITVKDYREKDMDRYERKCTRTKCHCDECECHSRHVYQFNEIYYCRKALEELLKQLHFTACSRV
jgi:hypothetical protein